MRRYPLAPLLEAMRCTLSQASKRLGIGGPEYRRYADEGLSRETAERKALRAGLHPYEVWPDMADHDLEDAEQAERERHERTKAIQRKSWRKRWDAMTEEEREAKREYLREYRSKARAAIRANRRRYYERNRQAELARQREYDARKRAERKAS